MAHEETTLEGMRVRKLGRGLYECQSQSDAKVQYQVDILANDGLGACDCADFRFRRLPRWQASHIPFDSFRCRHLRRVRCHVLDLILAPYIDQEKSVDDPTKRHYSRSQPNPT